MSSEEFRSLAFARQSSMLVEQDRPVVESLVRQLCELALVAPNHKRTNPWQFALFVGEGRSRLGRTFRDDMVAQSIVDEHRLDKVVKKYTRAPAVLVFGCRGNSSRQLHDENRDAVSAGVQNFMLGATALGLATFWTSAPVDQSPLVAELCRFEPGSRLVSVLYLGWARGSVTSRPAPRVTLTVIDR